ncbi:lactosylceramide 4-alpha-galactosyltransferase-like [Palaemon carinicauda]|uniref:lactosylceramide 4-alpha-galactosyltransferase-like n=1 Tax=Palaemon carinicauda TaxID=392227 RepID=UPI0035B62CFE
MSKWLVSGYDELLHIIQRYSNMKGTNFPKFALSAYVLLSMMSLVVFISKQPQCTVNCRNMNTAELSRNLRSEYAEEDVWWRKFICAKHLHPQLVPLKLPVLYSDVTPSRHKYNIFLVESSCVRRPAYRSICSVESYARQNPTADVWYVMITPEADNADGLLTELPKRYSNLRLVSADLDLLFRGLPTYKLFSSRLWMKSRWLEIHLSDMMRLALLGQTGGLFSDTDTVCMRDVTSLTNFVGLGTKGMINNAVFHFHLGNQILEKNLRRQNEIFDVEERGTNGLMVMTNVIKEACNFTIADIGEDMPVMPDMSVKRCLGVCLMPSKAFYPIPMSRCGDIFMENLGEDLMKL